MKKKLLFLCLVLTGTINSFSQCTTPNPPTSLALNATDNQLSIYFDTIAAAVNRYLVITGASPSLGASPVNGTIYNPGDNIGTGTVAFYSFNYIYKLTGLSSNTTLYIFVYSARTSCTGEPAYSSTSLTGSITTYNGGPGIPSNYYYPVGGLTCAALKTSLFNIIKPTVANPNPTYTGLWSAYYISDDHLNDAGNKTIVWDMYTDNPAGAECEFTFGSPYQDKGTSGTVECQRYNREHSFPQSWFGSSEPMRSDMFIAVPTDKKVNGQRGNLPYGEVSSPSYTSNNGTKLGPNTYLTQYTGNAFEPINEYKGDFARSTFYVATAYEDLVSGWQGNANASVVLNGSSYQCFNDWYLKLMYKWHMQDPVSVKEIDRNNDIYMIQGNRNPYIDHPEYVALVWQCTGLLPVTITDFTAQKNNEKILLRWYATYETNFKKYEIERSTDGSRFYKIGEVAGQNLANYSFTDNNLPNANTVYYLLKMIDVDGQFSNSKTIAVRIANNFSASFVYPNPAKEKLVVKLQQPLTENSHLIITDLSGRILMQQPVSGGLRNIDVNLHQLPAGNYFIKIRNNNESLNQSFVIIK